MAARNLSIDEPARTAAVEGTVRAYREHMNELGPMSPLDVWYERVDVNRSWPSRGKSGPRVSRTPCAWPRCTIGRAWARFRSSLRSSTAGAASSTSLRSSSTTRSRTMTRRRCSPQYVESLPPDRRPLLERWVIVDAARKVVGVGSVGTRCYLVLLMDPDGRTPLFLQLKEANEAVTRAVRGPLRVHAPGSSA